MDYKMNNCAESTLTGPTETKFSLDKVASWGGYVGYLRPYKRGLTDKNLELVI